MPECSFPAKALLDMRRRAAEEADASTDQQKLIELCEYIKTIEQLRIQHEELSGCRCWYLLLTNDEYLRNIKP